MAGRILVVDDNPVNRTLVRMQLERLRCPAAVVPDATSAVEALERGRFALVLMDCQMPEVDGYEAARRIRALEASNGVERTPIVAVTASTDEREERAALEAGMDELVTKPLSLEDLRAVLIRWLPESVWVSPPQVTWSTRGPVATSTEVVDDDVLRELDADLGSQAAARFVRTFLDELPARIRATKAALSGSDQESLGRVAHVMRSTCASVGAAALAQIFTRIDDTGRMDEQMSAEEAIRVIGLTADVTARALRAWLEAARH